MKKLRRLNLGKLQYSDKKRISGLRLNYDLWRAEQNPPIPQRCDNINCPFYSNPLIWNKGELKLILDHINGVNSDNRTQNLRLLCPNCDSQNVDTRGGANKGRVKKRPGGFEITNKSGSHDYTMFAGTEHFHIK